MRGPQPNSSIFVRLRRRRDSRSLHEKVIALREIHCFARRRAVISRRRLQISSHFQQMCANGIYAVVFGHSRIGLKAVQQAQTLWRAMHHR